jgi:hypothetical protein
MQIFRKYKVSGLRDKYVPDIYYFSSNEYIYKKEEYFIILDSYIIDDYLFKIVINLT